MGKPHVIVVAFPAQGHVAPLMKLAHKIADHGILVTFLNTEFVHQQIVAAMPHTDEGIRLVSVPDGLESNDDQNNIFKKTESMLRVMPTHLQNLIQNINSSSQDEQITCVIASTGAWWALELANKMGIESVAFFPAAVANLALSLHIPDLIQAGLIDITGTQLKDRPICLLKDMPCWGCNQLMWSFPDKPKLQELIFEHFMCKLSQVVPISNWILSNSFYDLEPAAHELVPNVVSIGPLLSNPNLGHHQSGNFWPEDPTCLDWLDNQPSSSVIYVAFGSIAEIGKQQFEELALGLESTGKPFLWVVRADTENGRGPEFPDGFVNRVAARAKIVGWANQEKVLSHSSTACFLSHCGWNSTMEGVSMGIPFLCWPCFADQYYNSKYICETWKIGVGLVADEQGGIITRHEIRTKITTLLSDDVIRANALKLKEMARNSVNEGGSSSKNFGKFIEELKHQDVNSGTS